MSAKSLAKARRLLHEGRVVEVTATTTFAVQGDHGTYLVALGGDGAACECPAWVVPCSHIEAVMLSTGSRLREPTSPSAPAAAPPEGRLFTWSWRAALDAEPLGVTLVRISLGRPKWVPTSRTATIPYIAGLAPAGTLFDLEGEEFEQRYRARLDGFGVERVERRFREVADSYSGRPLVLLCFEKSPGDCHRSSFARWWQERTGEVVPEYGCIP